MQSYCKDRGGVRVPYQERDLRCDVARGYLQQEGGGQVGKGCVLHRELVGASKRGRDGARAVGQKKGRKQAVVHTKTSLKK